MKVHAEFIITLFIVLLADSKTQMNSLHIIVVKLKFRQKKACYIKRLNLNVLIFSLATRSGP